MQTPTPVPVRIVDVQLYFLPVKTRVPLKFGSETLTSVTCARVAMTIAGKNRKRTTGWGETPLSVQWGWPSDRISYTDRHDAFLAFTRSLAPAYRRFAETGHALELGHTFLEYWLPMLLKSFNSSRGNVPPMPRLAALICASAFDIALHDAYGKMMEVPIYAAYGRSHLMKDLRHFLTPAEGSGVSFKKRYPADFLVKPPATLPAWHLVGGMDALDESDLTGVEPDDGYPVTLREWIARDGLTCLKIKLRGNDAEWDYARLVRVGDIAIERGVEWLSADFNCTVLDPQYVHDILDRLERNQPTIYAILLYVEQPFPYDHEANSIDVHSLAARKPLYMDESAHDWRLIRLGREHGWNGVALKTCKTQTGALLSLCWAKSHGMGIMVQDLTNPMLAQIPHVELAAHAGTIMGVETNGMQFYPAASAPEARVHPGLYTRRGGCVDRSSVRGPGFGYRLEEIERALPEPESI